MLCGLAGHPATAALASVFMIHAMRPPFSQYCKAALVSPSWTNPELPTIWPGKLLNMTSQISGPEFWLRQTWLTCLGGQVSLLSVSIHLLPRQKQVTRVFRVILKLVLLSLYV